jgi:hypothetical protein
MGIDSSGSSRPRRRSSRLNGIQATTESPIQTKHTSAAVASRKAPRRSYTPLDDGTQSDAQGGLEEVQDLRQQLQEERS